ncbi:MAG TPA: type IV secretion system protein, partial [Patescibacteria group bacterium]|nr:type IV secretion system protein [Patescibacteria group bacterium]
MKKILNKKFLMFLLIFAVAGIAFFSFTSPDLAMAQEDPDTTPTEDQDKDDGGGMGIQNKLIIVFGWLVYFVVWVLGKILLFVIGWLTQVAMWDQFISVSAVVEGWTIIRDLCNMFFILLLLAIAFATILRVESYNIKRLLPKVIIAAVLINFSRTICGFAVDISQIVMLTFVNAFAGTSVNNTGANNLVNMLGMDHMMEFIQEKDDLGGDLGMNTVGGIIVALIAALIAFVVICAMLAVLLFRIIMIWVYIVLSPLAFLLFAFPHGKGYASRWLSSFSKQVIVGPVLAFFLWLALYTAQESASHLGEEVVVSQGMEGGMMTSFLEAGTF